MNSSRLLIATMLFGIAAARPAAAAGRILGLETIAEPLPFYEAGNNRVRCARPEDRFPALRVLLSRSRYWAEDGHLDVIVQLAPPEGVTPAGTRLDARLLDAGGGEIARWEINPAPAARFVFYPALPDKFLGETTLEVAWRQGERLLGEERVPLRVERFAAGGPAAGHVPLRVENGDRVTAARVPMTVGVPFPRGAVHEAANLRLIDESGAEVPLQVLEAARWSKYGSLKWVLCDFTVGLAGEPRELYLEYGPQVSRTPRPAIAITPGAGFPEVDAGRLRFGDGLWFDTAGDGGFVKVLEAGALAGGFVEHEDGRVYRMPAGEPWEIEEHGPEKVVLHRAGWYREAGGREFCRHVTRWVIHRDSPFARVFHTWIFTGDGNRDRIRNMGWALPMAATGAAGQFLTAFGPQGSWRAGDYLLQHDYAHFEIAAGGETTDFPGGRAPGAAAARGENFNLYFGTKDFWQNYPSELEFAGGALWFHNWPRHNKPAHTVYDRETVDDQAWTLAVLQNRFAHEGEFLDFRLPAEAAADERVISGGAGTDPNAQGISRTEEFWLYLAPADADGSEAAAVLAALDGERLRAVTDPALVAASGAFYEIRQRDQESYPNEEHIYELVALAPARWAERLGIYGKWVYGDLPAWQLGLAARKPDIYRAYRKAHHNWPYSWVPFARSGDSRLLKWAQASTRQMIDANYSHYASDDIPTGGLGVWNVGPLPWASGGRPIVHSIHNKFAHLGHAWHLDGYRRALDNLTGWANEAKLQAPGMDAIGGGVGFRTPGALLKTYVETWEALFDPWFLAAAHAVADGHRHLYRTRNWTGMGVYCGDREFLRFSGSPEHREHYLNYAQHWGRAVEPAGASWQAIGLFAIEPNAYAFLLTGEAAYLGRVAALVDPAVTMVYESADPDYYQGFHIADSTATGIFTSYYLDLFPVALDALARAGRRPTPIPGPVALPTQFTARSPEDGFRFLLPAIVLGKEAGKPLALNIGTGIMDRRVTTRHADGARYRVVGPGGDEAAAGRWDLAEPLAIEIPGGAPAGAYRLQLSFPALTYLPVPVGTPDTPEVIELSPAEKNTFWQAGSYWFFVPADLERFVVEFRPPYQGRFLLASVWNPDGGRVWNVEAPPSKMPETGRLKAEIAVPPGHRGRLWRVVNPAGRGFVMDPRIPPVYAVTAEKWFQPDER